MKNSDNQKLIHDIDLIMNRLDAIKTNIKIIDDYEIGRASCRERV